MKTKIEWCDYTINPVKGLCPVGCSYCYARRLYKRFKWNPEIRMEPDWMEELPKKPSRVFVGSTMELFGEWVEEWMWDSIWQYVNTYPQHTFIFLTKQPQNLIKWSPFPDNCWVGVSATNNGTHLGDLRNANAKVKFISFEPLLKWDIDLIHQREVFPEILKDLGINWLIIGQCTPVKQSTMPKIEWVKEIVDAADKAKIPVFLKNNLNSCKISDYPELLDSHGMLRQEFPKFVSQ